MFYKIWEKYENNPIVMSFATKEIPIYEIPFPAVTICPESKCANEKFNYSDVFNRLYENQSVTDEE
jgi:amiloride-sensitive sodium channel